MVQMAKMLFLLLRELIFDNKEEYNFKSTKFNARKFIVLIVVCLSITANVWLGYRFIGVASALIHARHQLEKNCQTRMDGVDKDPAALAFSRQPHWIPTTLGDLESTKG